MSVDCIITTAGLFSPSRIKGQLIYSLYSYSFVIIRRPHCPEIQNHPTKETSFFFIPDRSINICVYERKPFK